MVDDNEDILETIGEGLKYLGYQVSLAKDGNEAVGLYKKALRSKRPFDLLIMDLTIPGGMGGKEAIKKLKEIDPTVKAVASSGYSNDPVMANPKEYGFSASFAKPYKMEKLSKTLGELLVN